MAPASNWLSFSLMSPMEMLRSSESESPFVPYDTSSTASPHYFLDNFYANGKWVLSLFFNRVFCMLCLVAEKIAQKILVLMYSVS